MLFFGREYWVRGHLSPDYLGWLAHTIGDEDSGYFTVRGSHEFGDRRDGGGVAPKSPGSGDWGIFHRVLRGPDRSGVRTWLVALRSLREAKCQSRVTAKFPSDD